MSIHQDDRTSRRSFRNSPGSFLAESLGGLIASHPDARWDPRGYVIRESAIIDNQGEPAVGIISGGGSGHEPLHAGFVGQGMLSAAVPGLLFTSPNAVQIEAATRGAQQGKGVLHIVKNYTGDVMNFQVARNAVDEIPTEVVLVDDDISTTLNPNTRHDDDGPGRRGTAATILVEKVAGEAAYRGESLQRVAELARRVAENSRSMAVALAPGHLPTTDRDTFGLKHGAMEVGVGIHGEPGTTTQEATDAYNIANQLVKAISDNLNLRSGHRVVLLVNGLGATTQLELNLVFNNALEILSDRGVTVERGLVGSFVTSVNMAGLSITLSRVDDEILELLDAPTLAPAWPKQVVKQPVPISAEPEFGLEQTREGEENRWLSRFVAKVLDNIDKLTELDRTAGDGDFGQNMHAALGGLELPLRGTDSVVLEHLSKRFLVRAGGTSGAVFGTLFRELAGASELAQGLAHAVEAISALGGAEVGDRTMIDALVPAAQAIKSSGDASGAVARAARNGAENTATLSARKGRASYLGERSRGSIDPGALVTAWLFEAREDER